MNFLTDLLDRRLTLRYADVMMYVWVGGKHACVYLSGVSPFVRLKVVAFTVEQTTIKATINKVSKHETRENVF